MVTLPPEFVATKYPGYFWNFSELRLYSLKISGELKPLTHIKANRWNQLWRNSEKGGYRVSVNGQYRWLVDSYLYNLEASDTQIPVNRDKLSRNLPKVTPNCS